jgi:hypothetical protein
VMAGGMRIALNFAAIGRRPVINARSIARVVRK